MTAVEIRTDLDGVDWAQLKADLAADDFDNGRTPDELKRSFEASYALAMGWADGRCVANARLLADGVCNAYLIDVWTHSAYRRRGAASAAVNACLEKVPGHHVALFTDHAAALYRTLGFTEDTTGMTKVVGRWLNRDR